MFGEDRIFEPVTAKNDLATAGQPINRMEDLVPGVFRH